MESAEELLAFFEGLGFVFEPEIKENNCLAKEAGRLLPFERALLKKYQEEGHISVKNFLNYLIEKRLPHLGELGWVLSGHKIVAPNDPACLVCPGRAKCFFG
ncbi:MAG: hypothetical protein PHG95_04510 [Patescibacteria group bacterium]|nr:hypothetical protein [Patescibacteria group bacterium]